MLLLTTLAVAVSASIFIVTASQLVTTASNNCSRSEDCGWLSNCNTTYFQCACHEKYSLHSNGKDCVNDLCFGVKDCVECSAGDKCRRCVNFISKVTGQCVDKCNGQAEISEKGKHRGNVCTEASDSPDVLIAVVTGVAAGLLLCVIGAVCICFYIRRTRKNINLQDKNYKSRELEMGKVKQIPVYDNQGFESESLRGSGINPSVYLQQLEELRPHTETLMTVLGQIRRKLRSMDQGDPRVPTYKGVIHQLCRVLVLLHKKDPTMSIPSDALGLIEWARQMLEDHWEQEEDEQSVSVGTGETPVNKISYIDVDFEHVHSPVYATPGGGQPAHPLNSSDTSGYYSSVPVPLPELNNAGYATINRTPVNPSTFNPNKNVLSKTASVKSKNNGKSRSGVVTNTGYFANGRYYDPSPQPVVYAPASSYSDRSAGPLSTFTGDFHRSRSFSDSESDEDDTSGEHDGFPFDPRDATDPVEV